MAKIIYSMAGEGRGHAARVSTIVEHLRGEHDFLLLAPDQAYDFLPPRYPAGKRNVRVVRIPGLRFFYTNNRLDLTKSLAKGFEYLYWLGDESDLLARFIDREQPDLAISDFEPSLPRAALKTGLPHISLSHQHFFLAFDLAQLPWSLRQWAWLSGMIVRAHCWGQTATIVSSFFRAPLRRGWERTTVVGPLLRDRVLKTQPARGDYVLSYLRKHTPARVIEGLKGCGREVRVYGLGDRGRQDNLWFRPISETTYVEDLAGCACAIGAAGNQSLGEALHFGKPVFAMPEAAHHEQLINSHFMGFMGVGDWRPIESVRAAEMHAFLDRLDEYREAAAQYEGRMDGAPDSIAVIRRQLAGGEAGRATTRERATTLSRTLALS